MICPQCQASTKTVRGKAYCQTCGWNLAHVEQELLDNVKAGVVLGLFLALVVVMVGWTEFLRRWPLEVIAVLAAMVLAIATVFVLANAKAVVEALRDWRQVSVEAAPRLEVPQEYAYLLLLQAPRPLRMTADKKKELGFYLLWWAWAGFLFFVIPSKKSFIDAALGILLAGFLFTCYLIVQELRTRRLLRSGELTFGRVIVKRRKSGGTITYEFQSGGQRVLRTIRDCSGSLQEGNVVPILYDAQEPSRSTTPAAAGYTVPQAQD